MQSISKILPIDMFILESGSSLPEEELGDKIDATFEAVMKQAISAIGSPLSKVSYFNKNKDLALWRFNKTIETDTFSLIGEWNLDARKLSYGYDSEGIGISFNMDITFVGERIEPDMTHHLLRNNPELGDNFYEIFKERTLHFNNYIRSIVTVYTSNPNTIWVGAKDNNIRVSFRFNNNGDWDGDIPLAQVSNTISDWIYRTKSEIQKHLHKLSVDIEYNL